VKGWRTLQEIVLQIGQAAVCSIAEAAEYADFLIDSYWFTACGRITAWHISLLMAICHQWHQQA